MRLPIRPRRTFAMVTNALAAALLIAGCGEARDPIVSVGPDPERPVVDVRVVTPSTAMVGGYLTILVTNASDELIGWFTCEEWLERGYGSSWTRPQYAFSIFPCQQVLATVAPGSTLQFQRVLSSQITPGEYRARIPLATLTPGTRWPGIATSSVFRVVAP